jgi:predicted PurR-regulated permease PerM
MNAPHKPADQDHSSRPSVHALRALAAPLWILAACILVFLLRLGRDALVPVALAILIALVLSGVVESLHRIRIPRGLSAVVLLAIVAVALAVAVDMVSTPAQEWVQSAPRLMRTIEHKLRPAQSLVRRLDAIAKRATALASPDAAPSSTAPAAPAATVSAVDLLAGTGWFVAAVLAVMALTLLLLAAGPPTLARMTAALSDVHAVRALRVIDAIRVEVGRYYATLAVINLAFGSVIAGTMWLFGMPNPILWGVLAGVLNFIPYLGAATTLAVLTLVALVSFDSIAHILLVGASYLGLAAIEGHVVEPIFLGRRLDLNPIVVFVALWLGGWIWGVPGVVVALPALVAAKVAASHSRHGEMLVRFLSPRGGNGEATTARTEQLRRFIGREAGIRAAAAEQPSRGIEDEQQERAAEPRAALLRE